MYLKKIEVKGFKSFADRTAIKPAFGVTCVVGPNGSGKSNITDAIRWVLGEQGAKILRGEKMEDIIFSGTGKRASLGFAEVKLVVDNGDGALPFDFEEVEISRRLYRSGESEYRINDTAARLKDIRDLFADTGVGLEGYSIIGQGRIDEIVGASPQDRRLLFDEAAGITAFKMKKAEAEKQLKSAEEDLKEVSIRLEEAEGSIVVLREEAEKAERFLELNGRYREIKINEYAREYETTNKHLERAKAKWQESGSQSEHFSSLRVAGEAKQEEQISALSAAQARLRATDKERYELAGRIRAMDTDLLLADEKRHGLEKQLRSLVARNNSGLAAYEKKTKERLSLMSEMVERRDALESLEKEIESASGEMTESAGRLAELRASVEEKRKAERALHAEMDRANARKGENERLLGELEMLREEFAASAELEEEVTGLKKEMDALVAKGAGLKAEKEGLDAELALVREKIAHLEKDAVRLKAEASFHQDSVDSFSDYEHAVQALMKERPEDILGVVGELFRVEKKYEQAIETALGRNIGILVCEKAETAKKYIDRLRTSRGGRVSFMPLEDVREGEKTDFGRFDLNQKEFEGVAADLISCDDRYRSVFQVLLGSILVATDFEAGRRLVKLGKRVVTLQGEVFIPGGIVTGGSTARSGKILSRRRLAEESRQSLLDAEKELAVLKADERKEFGRAEVLKGEILAHETDLSKRRLELTRAETELQNLKKQAEEQKIRYEREKSRLTLEKEEITEWIRSSEKNLSGAQEFIENSGIEISFLENLSTEKTEKLTELKVEHARTREQFLAKSGEVERLSSEIAEFEQERSGIDEEVAKIRTSLEEIDSGKEALESARRALLPKLEEFAETLTSLEEEVASAEERGRALSAELRTLEGQQRKAQEKAGRHQAECIRAESDLARIQSELLRIYEIGIDEALEEYRIAVSLRDGVEDVGSSLRDGFTEDDGSGDIRENGSDNVYADRSGDVVTDGCVGPAPNSAERRRSSLLPGRVPEWAVSMADAVIPLPPASEDDMSEAGRISGERSAESAEHSVSGIPGERERCAEVYFFSLSAEISFLEEQLAGLSGVSLTAIEEYRQRLERLSGIGREKEEIDSAIRLTKGFISEMAEEIQKRFHEGLVKIETSFDYAFKRLFGGGEAKIRVIGGEDILSSGVEMIVQPPGKKLRSISLLSGGEKALTAIALLFAFMEQRPSPFYILDEIEAPLDDVNLLKFTEFLKDYSERAQFLVITHRRATMEIADAIFGVTMEEYGVSKLISTKLD